MNNRAFRDQIPVRESIDSFPEETLDRVQEQEASLWNRGIELVRSVAMDLRRALRFEHKPISAESESPSEVSAEISTDKWMAQGEQPPAASAELKQAAQLQWLDHNVRTKAGRVLVAAMAFLGFSASFIECGAASEDAEPEVSAAQPKFSPDVQFKQVDHGIELSIDGNKIVVLDYGDTHLWNQDLPVAGSLTLNGIQANEVYQYHLDNVRAQYYNSFPYQEDAHGTIPNPDAVANITNKAINKYQFEPSAMLPGEQVQFSAWYGNLEFGDREYVVEQLQTIWQAEAQERGWGNLEDLDAYQWTSLIQLLGHQVEYDTTLTNLYGEEQYDKERADAVWNGTVSDWMQGKFNRQDTPEGKIDGICAYMDGRANVVSYIVADELYGLGERGLVYVPLIQYSDARHTRGSFVVAASLNEVHVVGIDTTNAIEEVPALQEMYEADKLSLTEAKPVDVTTWYTQQYSHDLMGPADQANFFNWLLTQRGDMEPVTQAIASRQLVSAEIQLAVDAANLRSSNVIEMKAGQERSAILLTRAFDHLLTQLDSDLAESNTMLLDPARIAPYLNLALTIGALLDKDKERPIHTNRAAKMIRDYEVHRDGSEPMDYKVAIDWIRQLHFLKPEEKQVVFNELEKLRAEFDLPPHDVSSL